MIAVKESKPEFNFITLRDCPSLRDRAAEWFHEKWGVPADAYLKCMTAYLKRETEYGWYLCLSGEQIVGGLGIIENDFHDRKDLTPNVCAVYTEEACRCQGVAGQLLNMSGNRVRAVSATTASPSSRGWFGNRAARTPVHISPKR